MSAEKYGDDYFRKEGRILPIDFLLKIAENGYKEKGKIREWKNREKVVLARRFPMDKISLEEHNGMEIVQSIDVFILVADQLKLCGTNKGEIARSHEVLQFLNEMFNKVGYIKFNATLGSKAKQKACKEYFQSDRFRLFGKTFIDQLQKKGNNFFLGRKLSAVDVFYAVAMLFATNLYPKALTNHPALEDYTKKLISHHVMKKLLDPAPGKK